jgi:hypothetical protein
MTAPCGYGEAAQGPLAQYPCPGLCGCWVRTANGACFPCWFTAWTYEPRDVRMLPAEDPRRLRVRDPRDTRRTSPWRRPR